MASEKLYTSHQAGALLQMDGSSIVKWANDGKLVTFRTPGGHRRIRQSDLLAFLHTHGMYVPPELSPSVKTVLVVDDDPVQLKAIRRAMKAHSDRVTIETAEGGIEALVKVGSLKPDALVLDLSMPDLDGLEVLQRLKANPATKALKIVILTGKPTAELEKKVLAAGALALLAKPLSAASLVELVLGRAGAVAS